jgi:hypothetical protein
MFLEEGTGAGHIKCPFTGKITNVVTKAVLNIPGPVYKPKSVKERPAKETKEQIDERELAALDAYHETGDPQVYFNTFRNLKS